MIETDEEGQRQMSLLIKNMRSSVFNDWEQGFIRDLVGKKYAQLTKNQKAVVTRLNDWLKGA